MTQLDSDYPLGAKRSSGRLRYFFCMVHSYDVVGDSSVLTPQSSSENSSALQWAPQSSRGSLILQPSTGLLSSSKGSLALHVLEVVRPARRSVPKVLQLSVVQVSRQRRLCDKHQALYPQTCCLPSPSALRYPRSAASVWLDRVPDKIS